MLVSARISSRSPPLVVVVVVAPAAPPLFSVLMLGGLLALLGLGVVGEPELADELRPGALVAEQALDLLAERRHVAERALERGERGTKLEERAQLGDLLDDALGTEVGEGLELERDGQ